MKKAFKIALPVIGTAAAAVAATAYLIAPGRAKKEQKDVFYGRNIAHRGLHTKDESIPENSLEAFEAAVENGYGIELDVLLTADDRVVVFHDDNLERMCGEDCCLEDLTYDELMEFRLARSNSKIPLFSEVLELIDGRVPIVLEIKHGTRNRELNERTYELVRLYDGDICVESFDPFIMRWWRVNAPEIMRGQLSPPYLQSKQWLNRVYAFVLSNCLTNFLCRPHFIAYGLEGKKPLTVRLCEKMGAMRFAWTSHDWIHELDNDVVIFEYYRPRTKYK